MRKRAEKFILVFGVVLSLFSSSFAACVCSHHAAKKLSEHAPSCHQVESGAPTEAQANAKTSSVSEGCQCFVKTAQPFVAGKSDNVEIHKNLAIQPARLHFDDHIAAATAVTTVKIHFRYHFYNSNYLRTLTPPRAPPVL